MKNLILIPLCLLFFNCTTNSSSKTGQNDKKQASEPQVQVTFYGDSIDHEAPKSSKEAFLALRKIKAKDTVNMTFKANTNAVCQKKGCWMKLDMPKGNDIKVTFKDYGFFVPKDISGQEVVVKGKAFLKTVSVDEQRHYAEDAGRSEKEIAAITAPKKEYRFVATGVAIPEAQGE